MNDKKISVMVIDRSNPHDVVLYDPGIPKEYTRIEEIEMYVQKHGYWMGRRDIALVTVRGDDYCSHCHRGKAVQHIVEPTKNGLNGTGMEFLSPEQLQECRDINDRILAALVEFPAMKWLLVDGETI